MDIFVENMRCFQLADVEPELLHHLQRTERQTVMLDLSVYPILLRTSRALQVLWER
jgi:hypothetical protein